MPISQTPGLVTPDESNPIPLNSDPEDFNPALWQTEPEYESAGSWLSSFLRNPGRTISNILGGGGSNSPPPTNLAPFGNFDIPDFRDGDSDSEHNALRVGQVFSYTLPADTFIDPEGDPITYSLSSGSILPPGITFDPDTRTLSGTMEDFHATKPYGYTYKISFVGTDPQGLSAKHGVYLEVVMPNRKPVRTEAELVNQVFEVNDPVKINMREYFRDPDGDLMRFTVDELPPGMTMQAYGSWLYGRLTEAFDGVITVTARDISGLTETMQFQFTVNAPAEPNQDPRVGTTIAALDLIVGEAVDISIAEDAFYDPDGDQLTLTQTGITSGLSLLRDPETGIYSITGTPTQNGRFTLVITATDADGAYAFQTIIGYVASSEPDLSLPNPPIPDTPTSEPEPILLHGGAGADRLFGDAGNDHLHGGNGNDTLIGRDGDDQLYGGSGHDTLYGDDGDDRLYGGSGHDTLYGDDGDDRLYGGSGNNRLYGGDGDDRLYGGSGNDALHGEDGDDRLYGGNGNNRLYGEDGDDILVGGAGKDMLTGGAGSDRFVLQAESSFLDIDIIRDFQRGSDKINISGITNVKARRHDSDGDGEVDGLVLLTGSLSAPTFYGFVVGVTELSESDFIQDDGSAIASVEII